MRVHILGLLVLLLSSVPERAGAQANVLCREPLRVRVSPDYLPYSHQAPDGSLRGLDISIIKRVFKTVGCPINLKVLPFKRAIIELAKGNVDMLPFASVTDHRLTFALFSRPYRLETSALIFRLEDVWRYPMTSLDDVITHGLVIGHERWSYRGERFERFLEDDRAKHYISPVTSTSEGILMLLAGRIDALVEMPAAVFGAADEMGLDGAFAEHPLTLWEEPVRFMFSKASVSPNLIAAVDKAIELEIRTDGYRRAYGKAALTGPEP